MTGRRFKGSRFRGGGRGGGDSSRDGKFRKFQSSDAEGDRRGDFPNFPNRTWQYDPRMQSPNGHESRSQWHIPSAHPDVERSKSVGRTDPSNDRRPIESDRRSTPGRRSPDRVDRARRSASRPASSHEIPPERSPRPSRPGSSHEVPPERSTPKHRDIPEEEISRNGRSRRKRDRERMDEKEWPEGELPPEKIYAEQQLLELKPIPVYHLNERIPRRDVDQSQRSRHHFFPDVPENSQGSPSESITMVIIDQTSPNHELNKDHATIVENKLKKKLLKAVKMGTSVQFETQEYDGKFLRFACANQETCDWLTSAVGNIGKLWEGASLAVVSEHDIPKFTQVKAFIPGRDISQETCQNALAVQNPKLDIHKWVLWECKENQETKGFDLVFGVPEDLLPKVSAVKGKAYYMFSKILLKIVNEERE